MTFKKNENYNHPRKGSLIKSDPIKQLTDIQKIKQSLLPNKRNYALFTLAINTNLRASDLLNLKFKNLRISNHNWSLILREKKTKKQRLISLNSTVTTALTSFFQTIPTEQQTEENFLFSTFKQTPLSVPYFSGLVKKWCHAIGLQGNYSSHTLRKTWGYHQRVTFKTDIPTLMVAFNHSTQFQTLNYLCIQPEEIKAVYMNQL